MTLCSFTGHVSYVTPRCQLPSTSKRFNTNFGMDRSGGSIYLATADKILAQHYRGNYRLSFNLAITADWTGLAAQENTSPLQELYSFRFRITEQAGVGSTGVSVRYKFGSGAQYLVLNNLTVAAYASTIWYGPYIKDNQGGVVVDETSLQWKADDTNSAIRVEFSQVNTSSDSSPFFF
jgi:hypothetical protein